MKKNKIIKRTVKPKNNYFKYAAMVLLVVFAAVGVSQILGFEINKDTTVCMDKKGNLFVPLDKEGKIDSCGKHDGAVTFNFEGGSGGGSSEGPILVGGKSFFIDGQYLLDQNGIVWTLTDRLWDRQEGNKFRVKDNVYDTEGVLISNFDVSKIIMWNEYTFIDEENNLYRRVQEGGGSIWMKVSIPPVVE